MDICTICKRPIPESESPSEIWKTPSGEDLHLGRSAMPYAIAETSIGEFEICELCYRRGLPSFFTSEDLAEIHYQFGLEYKDRGDFARSVESLTKALEISETADIIASLALAQSKLGHREIAIAHYRRALEIAPSHFMSRENLKLLLRSD